MALDDSGHVWFWGQNSTGQLGDGTGSNTLATTGNYYPPTDISSAFVGLGSQTITQIAIGSSACLALSKP